MPSEEILLFFAKYIEAELGIIYADHNYFQLQNRLEEIAKRLSFKDVEQLYQAAKDQVREPLKQMLLDLATNNETSFFRDPKLFSALENTFLTAAVSKAKGVPLKIWSAASSTGQEALTMAILISEFNTRTNSEIPFTIIGTDVSDRALNKAKSNCYSSLELQRGLSPELTSKYFRMEAPDKWKALSSITKNVSFKKMNLKEPFSSHCLGGDSFDLILCRNVLIYQNVAGKRSILEKIFSVLSREGTLVLGSGESLLGISSDFDQQNIGGAIIYNKKGESQKAVA